MLCVEAQVITQDFHDCLSRLCPAHAKRPSLHTIGRVEDKERHS